MKIFLDQAYSKFKLEQEFNETGSVLYLACEGERIAGFLRIRQSTEVEYKLGSNTIELQRLYIHKDFQNKKVGSTLMQKAMDYALKKNVEWIWLGVWERNFNAQRFYAKCGFEKFGEHIFQMGDDPQIDWLLKKKL